MINKWNNAKDLVYICAFNHTNSMPEKAKINQLLTILPKGAVILSSWLTSNGYSHELQQRYRKSGWLSSIGKGAMVRTGDSLRLTAAVAALQQSGVPVHIGGRSALSLLGFAQYVELAAQQTTLFAGRAVKLPEWLKKNHWDAEPSMYHMSLFDTGTGLVDYRDGEIMLKISGAARAMMECIALCPERFLLSEAYELMEGLNALRPMQVQELLEQCKSIKTKRLFLYFAEKANHAWLKYVDTGSVDLGSGKRSIVPNGVLTSKYELIITRELAE